MYMSLLQLVELTDGHVLDLSQEFCSVMFIGKRKLKQPSENKMVTKKVYYRILKEVFGK